LAPHAALASEIAADYEDLGAQWLSFHKFQQYAVQAGDAIVLRRNAQTIDAIIAAEDSIFGKLRRLHDRLSATGR
jgi:hypothetical protein